MVCSYDKNCISAVVVVTVFFIRNMHVFEGNEDYFELEREFI